MQAFRDEQDRTWDLVVNVATAKRVRDRLQVDILKLYAGEAERIFCDPVLLVDVLYVLCEPQCQQKQVSDVDFGGAMVGDALERAGSALMEAVADFFPKAKSQLLRQIKSKGEQAAETMLAAAAKFVETVDLTTSGMPSTT